MNAGRRSPLFARAGTFFLAAGFAGRFLMLDDVHPVAEATMIGMLMLGSGLLLLDRALAGGAAASVPVLLLPLLLLWVARSGEPAAVKRAIDVWAACSAGFAIRGLARDRAAAADVRAALAAAALALAVFGIAQTLWLRAEVARVAEEIAHAITHSEQGRAFLGSWRAAATFISPNAFGGFLLLAGIPLLAAAIAALRGSGGPGRAVPAALAAAIVLGGFACAGSAGAAVAGILGVSLAAWICARTPATRIGFGAAFLALACGAAGLAIGVASGSGLTGKLRTLQERIDYHETGLRLLRATWPEGTGLEQAGRLMSKATQPGDAYSRFIHDWWLQGLVEAGIAFVPVALALVWAIARGSRRALVAPAVLPAPGTASTARTWWRGLAAGAVAGLLLEPMVSVLPYGFGPRVVLALATAAVFAGAAVLARRLPIEGPAFARGLAAGVLAFAIHGLVDLDLAMPGVMLAFAAALALLAAAPEVEEASPPPRPFARALTGAFGLVNLLAPVAVILIAATREHVH